MGELTLTGRVEVAELSRRHGVSEHTIRRDLRALAERGFLQKTHGGAVALNTTRLDWKIRAKTLPAAKEHIGAAAARLVKPGQTVILEAGSTTLALARQLTARPLTVVTNSLDVAHVFDGLEDVKLVVLGGVWDARARVFRGVAAQHVLASYRADWTVLGACALHVSTGATVVGEEDATLKRAMAAAGLKTMVLADHSKRDQVAAHLVLATARLDLVVTDQPWPDLAARGVQVLCAAGQDALAGSAGEGANTFLASSERE